MVYITAKSTFKTQIDHQNQLPNQENMENYSVLNYGHAFTDLQYFAITSTTQTL